MYVAYSLYGQLNCPKLSSAVTLTRPPRTVHSHHVTCTRIHRSQPYHWFAGWTQRLLGNCRLSSTRWWRHRTTCKPSRWRHHQSLRRCSTSGHGCQLASHRAPSWRLHYRSTYATWDRVLSSGYVITINRLSQSILYFHHTCEMFETSRMHSLAVATQPRPSECIHSIIPHWCKKHCDAICEY